MALESPSTSDGRAEDVAAPLASQVCLRCKARKKKCDKALPSCARCTRLKVQCQYAAPDTGESRGLPTPPDVLDIGNMQLSGLSQNRSTYFLPEMVSSFAFITSYPDNMKMNALRPGGHQILDFDEQLTKQVQDIMTRNGDDINEICTHYFLTYALWLPIIDKPDFLARLPFLQTKPDAAFSIALLSIYLTTRMSKIGAYQRERLDQLYHTTKGLHSLILATGRSSIFVVQAGLLLALFEYSQAFHDAAYLTIGACARMGYILGLHKSLRQQVSIDEINDARLERERHVWWGTILLERIIKLERMNDNLPFACQNPTLDDKLPTHGHVLLTVSEGLEINGVMQKSSSVEPDVYGRIAQCAYLLGHVLDTVTATEIKGHIEGCRFAELDATLRAFAMSLLQPDGGDKGHHCWPYTIAMSALLTLNRHVLYVQQNSEADGLVSRARLAVTSITRMVLDGMGTDPEDSIPKQYADFVPPWALNSGYVATLMHIQLGNKEDLVRWAVDLAALKSSMDHFSSKWRLAEIYLKTIEAAETCAGAGDCEGPHV